MASKLASAILGIFLCVLLVIWALDKWEDEIHYNKVQDDHFFQVTNRDLSIFFFQNPGILEYTGKVPYFNSAEVPIILAPHFADVDADAPVSLLYRYQVWKRLLYGKLAKEPIYVFRFVEFLNENCMWLPSNWAAAPHEYVTLISSMEQNSETDLSKLSYKELPYEVRVAFQGWRSYTLDWDDIRSIDPTGIELEKFLVEHKEYLRPLWINFERESTPHYLKSFSPAGKFIGKDPHQKISEDELTAFLKMGLFNSQQSQSHLYK